MPVHIMDNVSVVFPHEDHTLVLDLSGQLWGMGSNNRGQLGVDVAQLQEPRVLFTDVCMAALGRDHSLVLKEDGSLWGMGSNAYGQLGLEDSSDVRRAVRIADDVTSVWAARHYSMVMLNDGQILGWGLSDFGQLGPFGQ